jgi:hypothetical protein
MRSRRYGAATARVNAQTEHDAGTVPRNRIEYTLRYVGDERLIGGRKGVTAKDGRHDQEGSGAVGRRP